MADAICNPFGTTPNLTVPANGTIAVWSLGAFDVIQVATSSSFPPTPVVLASRNANGTQFKSGVLSTTLSTTLRVFAKGGQPVYYSINSASATADATQVANVITNRHGVAQSAGSALNADGVLTGGAIRGGKITSTTGAAVAATLDTGTVMDTTGDWAIDDVVIWFVLNTGGNTFTVTAAASGHTLEGNGAVVTVTPAMFETRKTAAATFVTTRMNPLT